MPKEINETNEAALAILEKNQRDDSMKSALDIVSTTLKLRIEEELKEARKAEDEAKVILEQARRELNIELWRHATTLLLQHPAVRPMREAMAAMCGGNREFTAEEVFEGLDSDYSTEDALAYNPLGIEFSPGELRISDDEEENQEKFFRCWADTHLRFSFTDDKDSSTETFSQDVLKVDLFYATPGSIIRAAVKKKMDAYEANDAAFEHRQDCQDRLKNHGSMVDVARVNLQRDKLGHMGGEASLVLAKVDTMLEASEVGGFMKLL